MTGSVHLGNSEDSTNSQQDGSPTTITYHHRGAGKGELAYVSGKFVYTDADGTVYTCSSTVQAAGAIWQTRSRRVERIDFPDGRVQTFSYNGSGYLKLVDDSAGYAMVFDYNGNGDATAACIFNQSQPSLTASSPCRGAALPPGYRDPQHSSESYRTAATKVLGKT